MRALVRSAEDAKSIVFILENLGRLPDDFDATWALDLLQNDNAKIRLNAVRILAKAKRMETLDALRQIAGEDSSTEVRREAVAAIGRMRNRKTLDVLLKFLTDPDPKVVTQAIRGLLIFKGEARVDKQLIKLRDHENEIVQAMLRKEYGTGGGASKDQRAHWQSYDYLKNVAVHGDTRAALKLIPDESFHLTFTSPPYYNARDYSIYPSYKSYLAFLREVFKLTHAKTKEGRFLIVNTSPVIVARISRAHASKRYPIPFDLHAILTAIGWEFIDDIVWVKPEASVKNRNAGFLQHRKPLAYKPNARTEYLMVYRKQTDKLLDWNIRQYDSQTVQTSKVGNGFESSNVWKIDPTFNKTHSAVFPLELCERVLRYYSYEGDLVFDPFAGSGTFGRAAKNLRRHFFMTEAQQKYFDYMKTTRDLADPQVSAINHERAVKFLTLHEFKRTIQ